MSVKYFRHAHASVVWGVYTPKIFDGCMSVKYLTHAHASIIGGVYTPKIFDGHISVKNLVGLRPLNI